MNKPTLTAALLTFFAFASLGRAQVEVLQEQEVHAEATGWLDCGAFTGDWGGLRPILAEHGISISGGYLAEGWGNTTGGIKTGAVYTGFLDFAVDVDLEKLVGWKGAKLHNNWFWLSGRDASQDLVGNIFTISYIAGFSTFRLFELWFEQAFFDDLFSIRLGQLAADQEFAISDTAALFINGTFGWPASISTSLPEGGPGYPMATLGMRLAVHPVDWFSFLAAGFQGNPFAQDVNRHGFRWRLDAETGFTFLTELQFRWNQEAGLPGSFKTGAWFNTEFFEASDGSGDEVWGDCGFYWIVDQMLFREPAAPPAHAPSNGKTVAKATKEAPAELSDQGLTAFGRIGTQPQDRNLLGFYFDTGLAYKGPIPGRDADTVGLAMAFGHLSNGAGQLLLDEGSREVGYEIVIEATYDAEITSWLHIQPDIQYVIHPGATGDLGNALVLGCRLSVVF